MPKQFDVIIVGQGIAGTTLQWSLRDLGIRSVMVDRCESSTSSRIAAGLVTPITGQRFVTSWRLETLWPFAKQFYRRVESESGVPLLTSRRILRLIKDDREQAFFDKRQADWLNNQAGDQVDLNPCLDADSFNVSHSAFEILDAAQLDVPRYLDVSRRIFEDAGEFIAADIDMETDVAIHTNVVEISRLKIRSNVIVSCQGFDARTNNRFRIPFDAAKGEILTLKVPSLDETRIVNRGVWLARLGDGVFRAGATYDRDRLDHQPTQAGRDEIEARLGEFLRVPFEVIDHQAAVRPAVVGRHPVLGFPSQEPRLAVFNGLGSKGTLQAPYFAHQLAEVIAGRRLTVEPEVDVAKRTL